MLAYADFNTTLPTGEDVVVEIEILYDPPNLSNRESDWDYYGQTNVVNVWLYYLGGKQYTDDYDEDFINKEIDIWLRGRDIEQMIEDNQPF